MHTPIPPPSVQIPPTVEGLVELCAYRPFLDKHLRKRIIQLLSVTYKEYALFWKFPKLCTNLKPTCRNLPVKALCGRCLSEFIDLRYSQSCLYFRPSFVNCCPSNFLSGSSLPLSPPPPSIPLWISIKCVRGGGGRYEFIGGASER
jgi:hypothetical protein